MFSYSCFATSFEDPNYLIFEDLTEDGFENVNRRTGLDFEHYKHVLSKIAVYHAATAALLKQVNNELMLSLPKFYSKSEQESCKWA